VGLRDSMYPALSVGSCDEVKRFGTHGGEAFNLFQQSKDVGFATGFMISSFYTYFCFLAAHFAAG
jgi:hypothetical protein